MIDPLRHAVLIRSREGVYEDKTHQVRSCTVRDHETLVVFTSGGKVHRYRAPGRVVVLDDPDVLALDDHTWVEVRGDRWASATRVLQFRGHGHDWVRVFYRTKRGTDYRTYPAAMVRTVRDAATTSGARAVLDYLRSVAAGLPNQPDGRQNSLHTEYERLRDVHPDSALARYLNRAPVERREDGPVPIYPFSSNISQREAVRTALRHSFSVIDGPPGTGKTQTILNIVASVVATPGLSIGIVSFNNSAVDNVLEKLSDEGFGHVAAHLGRRDNRVAFLADQTRRNRELDALVSREPVRAPSTEELAGLDRRLDRLQDDERRLAQVRQELEAHRLERRHFVRHLDGQELLDLDGTRLVRLPPERILDFLAESQPTDVETAWPLRWVRRLRWLVRYGPLRGVDPMDTDTVLALQHAYYDRRVAELEREVEHLESVLDTADLAGLLNRQRALGMLALSASLDVRYSASRRVVFEQGWHAGRFDAFVAEYPVILSTCHSLRASVGRDRLLDYLVVDEASQVDLAAAGIALATAKNVVVVGDLQQLPHIADKAAAEAAVSPPDAAYDYTSQSMLSSVLDVYGDAVPRTMLREHYRCDPAIIGFCNEKFYDGRLIPFTTSPEGSRAMTLHRTARGNHMRTHREGGRSNRREIEVIVQEVLSQQLVDIAPEDIGIATPYRRQADTITSELVGDVDAPESSTVHKFQGREKRAVVMSTVLDETWRGRTGTAFVDDPHMVNVAVSRAIERFVLVTNHDMLPTSTHLRDLMEYIRYHDPEEGIRTSSVVSVFDLLYQHYAERLRPLAGRLRGELRYRSEDIVWTVLNEILAEEQYAGLTAQPQMLLRNLLPGPDRLTPEQSAYVKHRASVDFVVYRKIGRVPLLAIEVDGFAYHENDPRQRARDRLKDQILATHELPLLRLRTTESDEESRIRSRLDDVLR